MKKEKFIYVLWLLLGVAGLVCIFMVFFSFKEREKLGNEEQILSKKLLKNIKTENITPTTSNIFYVDKEYKWLKEEEKKIYGLLSEKQLPEEETMPLVFKEKLLDTKKELRQLADIQGCYLTDDIGFSIYAGGGIPQPGETVRLNKQLKVVTEIIEICLKQKVEEIISVERLSDVYYGKQDLYSELFYRVKIQCTVEDLLSVLHKLRKTTFFTVIKSMDIEKVKQNSIRADIILGVVEFKY